MANSHSPLLGDYAFKHEESVYIKGKCTVLFG